MNCWVAPFVIEAFAGVTVIDVSVIVGAVTVNVAFPTMPPEVALICAVPAAFPVASPPLRIVATAVADDDHVTELVMSLVAPVEYFPVALNCCVAPTAMVAPVGVTWMLVSRAAVATPHAKLSTTTTDRCRRMLFTAFPLSSREGITARPTIVDISEA